MIRVHSYASLAVLALGLTTPTLHALAAQAASTSTPPVSPSPSPGPTGATPAVTRPFTWPTSIPTSSPTSAPVKLPALPIDPQSVTVSGISSGAMMSVQLLVARSSIFRGAATVAGGPYFCAKGNAETAQRDCMGNPDAVKVPELLTATREFAAKNQIDPLETLRARGSLFILQGTADTIVKPALAGKLEAFFAELLPEEKIESKTDLPVAHGFPTLNTGIQCDKQGKPWLNRCDWDGAGAILATLYAGETGLAPRGSAKASNLTAFDQSEFDAGTAKAMLGPKGWVYIPEGCRSPEAGKPLCRLHVALHGCAQSPEFTQDAFATSAGYNDWAESNRIVILYPSATTGSGNPCGCWDWWGYTGANYATRDGAQIKAISAMVDRLTGQSPRK